MKKLFEQMLESGQGLENQENSAQITEQDFDVIENKQLKEKIKNWWEVSKENFGDAVKLIAILAFLAGAGKAVHKEINDSIDYNKNEDKFEHAIKVGDFKTADQAINERFEFDHHKDMASLIGTAGDVHSLLVLAREKGVDDDSLGAAVNKRAREFYGKQTDMDFKVSPNDRWMSDVK